MRDVFHVLGSSRHGAIRWIFEDDGGFSRRQAGGDGQVDSPVKESVRCAKLFHLNGGKLVVRKTVRMILVTNRLGATIAMLVERVEESRYGERRARKRYHHGIEFSVLGLLQEERELGVVH